MDDFETKNQDRIREVAHRIWREEGCPHGRDEAHWHMARQLVAIELNQKLATKPVDAEKLGPEGEPIEEARIQENLGEFPTLTDQGEQQVPHRIESEASPSRSASGGGESPKRARASRAKKKGA
jgi:hypothetical protein